MNTTKPKTERPKKSPVTVAALIEKAYAKGFLDGHRKARQETIYQVNTPLVSRKRLMDILFIQHN